MKVLIPGGCGFVGSHLVERFLAAGFDVRVLGLKCELENLNHLLKDNEIEFQRGDVSNPDVCREAVEGCDLVSHVAALVSIDHSIEEPRPFWEVNVIVINAGLRPIILRRSMPQALASIS